MWQFIGGILIQFVLFCTKQKWRYKQCEMFISCILITFVLFYAKQKWQNKRCDRLSSLGCKCITSIAFMALHVKPWQDFIAYNAVSFCCCCFWCCCCCWIAAVVVVVLYISRVDRAVDIDPNQRIDFCRQIRSKTSLIGLVQASAEHVDDDDGDALGINSATFRDHVHRVSHWFSTSIKAIKKFRPRVSKARLESTPLNRYRLWSVSQCL